MPDESYLRGRKQGYNPPVMSIPNLLRTASLLIGSLLFGTANAQHEGHGQEAQDHTDAVENAMVEVVAADTEAPELAKEEAEHGGKFDAGQLIMGHIGDEHGWHLWGHTTLPLPIIVYNTERGVSCFSSSHFDHGHKTYGGYMLHEGSIVATKAEELTTRRNEAQSAAVDVDESESAESFELPGADLSGEELSVRVVPKQADEFTCSSCFLVHHRSRLASEKNGEMLCTDCAV